MEDNLQRFKDILEIQEFPFNSQSEIDEFTESLIELKKKYVSENNQQKAKEFWIIERIFIIKLRYHNAWLNLRNRKYKEAWEELVFCEKDFEYLKSHFNYYDNDKKGFFLKELEELVLALQSLFPYGLFVSPSYIIKKRECSICHQVITPFNRCDHNLREIYNGEICFHLIKDFEIRNYAFVKRPRWKLRYVKPERIEFDYSVLSTLLDRSKNSIDGWKIVPYPIFFHHDGFSHFNKNDYCPCGSSIKYGNCCLKKDKIHVTAYEILTNSKPYNNHIFSMTLHPIEVKELDEDNVNGEGSFLDPRTHYLD